MPLVFGYAECFNQEISMSIQPKCLEFEYSGFKVLAKANPATTKENAWFPSYQISNSEEHEVSQPPGFVKGSDDWQWVLEEAERLAKEHIDTL